MIGFGVSVTLSMFLTWMALTTTVGRWTLMPVLRIVAKHLSISTWVARLQVFAAPLIHLRSMEGTGGKQPV